MLLVSQDALFKSVLVLSISNVQRSLELQQLTILDAIDFASDHHADVPKLRSHDIAPLHISIHVATPSRGPSGRVRRAIRLERVAIVCLHELSTLHVVPRQSVANKYSSLSLGFNLFVRKMLFKIECPLPQHHVHLPSVTFFIWCSQYSAYQHDPGLITARTELRLPANR